MQFNLPANFQKKSQEVLTHHHNQVCHNTTDNLMELSIFRERCMQVVQSEAECDVVIKQLELDQKLIITRDTKGNTVSDCLSDFLLQYLLLLCNSLFLYLFFIFCFFFLRSFLFFFSSVIPLFLLLVCVCLCVFFFWGGGGGGGGLPCFYWLMSILAIFDS